jgi:hypothetical protein
MVIHLDGDLSHEGKVYTLCDKHVPADNSKDVFKPETRKQTTCVACKKKYKELSKNPISVLYKRK